jgi:hypothetical protein
LGLDRITSSRQLLGQLLLLAAGHSAQGVAQAPGSPPVIADVRVFATDTLSDLAVTVIERGRSTIYYNPTLLERVGPRLARFFLAHEYGHIVGGHGGGAFGAGDPDFPLARRAQELVADCYAAQRLVANDPADVDAAIRFFDLIGDFRFDDLHPSGTERATRIAACAASRARPVTAGNAVVTIVAPTAPISVYGCEARVWIDQVPVGAVSNLRAAGRTLVLHGLEPGIHAYSLVVQVYHLDNGFQLTPVGTVEAMGTVPVPAGGTLVVEWTPGDSPSLREAP